MLLKCRRKRKREGESTLSDSKRFPLIFVNIKIISTEPTWKRRCFRFLFCHYKRIVEVNSHRAKEEEENVRFYIRFRLV